MPHNKRLVPRFKVNLTVVVKFKDEIPIVTTTADASPFGAFIKCDKFKPIGTRLIIDIVLPSDNVSTSIECTVAHNRTEASSFLPVGFGVCFIINTPEQIALLMQAFSSFEVKQEA